MLNPFSTLEWFFTQPQKKIKRRIKRLTKRLFSDFNQWRTRLYSKVNVLQSYIEKSHDIKNLILRKLSFIMIY